MAMLLLFPVIFMNHSKFESKIESKKKIKDKNKMIIMTKEKLKFKNKKSISTKKKIESKIIFFQLGTIWQIIKKMKKMIQVYS